MPKTKPAFRVVAGVAVFIACLRTVPCSGQQFDLPPAAVEGPAILSKWMPDLARAVIAIYTDGDRLKHLDNLFRLQIVAGQFPEAARTLNELRALRVGDPSPQVQANNVQYEIFARAKTMQAEQRLSFEQAFQKSFREAMAALDDKTSALVIRALGFDQSVLHQDLEESLEQQKGKSNISLLDALKLVRAFQTEETYRNLAPLTPVLIAEDDDRRYVIDKDVSVKAPDGATLCALIVRPRSASQRRPTLLTFTIYAETDRLLIDARRTASNGYVAVAGFTRGKTCSPEKPIPYEHDGPDAAAMIDWISKQRWSDGRVGMYGGSYSGFTAWAAAKQMPKALKAIMVGAPVAPGIDVPMEGNVFWNFIYPWPFYTTNNKALDNATYNDKKRWNRLNHGWYASGRAYRSLEQIDGTLNPIFDEWIAHPTYDGYWQGMIPYKKEFGRVNVPVLSTAGYYYGGPGAAVYYFNQHYKYRPNAEHYFLIGPYDHLQGQRGTINALGERAGPFAGYELDAVAHIDISELRYQWFDYVLKKSPRPTLLKDKVNYEVMGADVWKHAPSIAVMSNHKLRFYLGAVRSGDAYRLSAGKPAEKEFIAQTVDLADRSDVDRVSVGGGVLDKAVDTWNGVEFVSDPISKSSELSGLFAGQLDFIINKKDFDFNIALYERTFQNEYLQLSSYWGRASHVGDVSHRRLLTPGKRQHLDFQSVRLISRQVQSGSRLVVVLSVIKEPGRQINYGTGKDVSDETIADAKEPLQIKWFADSFIDVPLHQ